MSAGGKCQECGADIPGDSPGGFCAQCLLGLGLAEVQSPKSEVQTLVEDAEEGVDGKSVQSPKFRLRSDAPVRPAKVPSQQPEAAESLTGKPGDRIGRYRLLQEIGHGGCGVVYMAEQMEPVRRKVALKVIKLGMDTRQVVARFEAERQALALMDHSSIAKVLDAGATETGRPFFVMELVGGIKITDYCDQNQLTTRQRLDLFIQVCLAVQHAHQKGVIHRDLKPSNVLVATQDGVPVPKVIDFGIAKATLGRLTDQTVFTAFEQFLGTPAYMSPEQAELGGLDIDTRSDIYSLGVLLYELLTGKTPFDTKEMLAAGLDEMRRTIREVEPVKPSTRLTQERLMNRLPDSAKSEIQNPKSEIDRDLDWIVMKCLEKDRARRYETANGLARDIERHMSNEPVMARPPSRLYSLQKLYRRNRLVVTASALILVVGILGVGGVFWEWRRAEQNAQLERSHRNRAEQATQRTQAALNQMEAIEVRRAEEYYEAGDRRHMLPYLARVLRQNPSNRIAAERLFSALSHRTWARLACPPLEHSNRLTSALFSGDGRRVVTSSADSTAWVWDSASGQRLAGPFSHAAEINTAVLSEDGSLVVTASKDKTARVWNAVTGVPVTPPLPHSNDVSIAFFILDGKQVFTVSGSEGQLWSLDSGQRIGVEFNCANFVQDARPSPDGTCVAMACVEGHVEVFDVKANRFRHHLRHTGNVWSVAFSPDGKYLATASEDTTARVWEVATGQPAGEPLRHAAQVWGAEFSPDGQRIVTASGDHTAQVWDVRTGQKIGPPLHHDDRVRSAMFSPEGLRVATASGDNTVRVWDALTGEPLTEPLVQESGAFQSQFHPDGQRVLTVSNGKAVTIWDIHPSMPAALSLDGAAWCARFSPDSKKVVLCPGHPGARVLDSLTGKMLTVLRDDSFLKACGDNYVDFSPDGQRIAMASDCGAVGIWDSNDGRLLNPIPAPLMHTGEVISVRFSHDGRRLVTASWDFTARVLDAQTYEPLTSPLRHDGKLSSAEFSPDDRYVLTAGLDSRARIWDVQNGRVVKELRHESAANSARFSPDGTRILTTCDMTARIWDARTGDLLGTLSHDNLVCSARFSPDGQRVVTTLGNRYHKIRLWDARTFKPLTEPFGEGRLAEFTVDGERLITGAGRSGDVRVWDGWSGQRLSEGLQQGGNNRFFAISPDGCFVLAANNLNVQIWEAPAAPLPVPEWLPELAEALAGQRVNQQGRLEPVRPADLWAVQQKMSAWVSASLSPQSEFYGRWARWFLADPSRRTVLPSSPQTLAQHAQSLAEQRVSPAAAKEALLLQPTNGLHFMHLAYLDPLSPQADWRSRRATELLPESFKSWWTRGYVLMLTNRLPEALQMMQRALERAPTNAGVWKDIGTILERTGRREDARTAFTKAIELSGDPEEGKISRGALLQPDPGFALCFSDIASYIAVPHTAGLNTFPLTVMAWVNTCAGTGQQGLVNKYVSSSNNGWNLFLRDGRVRAWYFADDTRFVWDGGEGLDGGFVADGGWHHIAFTVDASGGRLYVDGLLRASRPWNGAFGAATTLQEVRLGNYPSGIFFFNGSFSLDEISIWRVALGQRQIMSNLFIRLTGNEADLLALYRCEEGSGSSVADTAPLDGSNNGVWVGTPRFKPTGEQSGGANSLAINEIPPGPSDAGEHSIDLSAHYNVGLDVRPEWSGMPHGMQTLAGVRFDIRGWVQLIGIPSQQLLGLPSREPAASVQGIRVSQKCQRLHFLQGSGPPVPEGTLVARYVIHYADREQAVLPVIYGEDVGDRVSASAAPPRTSRAVRVWTGADSVNHPQCRLYCRTWQNPRPEVEVASIDFLPCDVRSEPFLVALTSEP